MSTVSYRRNSMKLLSLYDLESFVNYSISRSTEQPIVSTYDQQKSSSKNILFFFINNRKLNY